ncbi:hypothetical protein AB0945_08900 [Streptomyces sp. NPDC005474]
MWWLSGSVGWRWGRRSVRSGTVGFGPWPAQLESGKPQFLETLAKTAS